MVKALALLLLLAQEQDPVHIQATPDRESYSPGDKGSVVLRFEMEEPWHIYGPDETTGIPTKVVPQPAAGIEWGKVEYPPSVEKEIPDLGVQKLYEHEVEIRVPFTVQEGAAADTSLLFLVDYMTCTDETCLAPQEGVEVRVAIKVQGGGEPAAGATDGKKVPPPKSSDESFLAMLGLAFLGGLLLNVMPCVLPVLTLKLFSLVEQKEVTSAGRISAALFYTAGVLFCLTSFALVVVLLRAWGSEVGWGFQFQEPGFVIALTTIVFVFALSLLGVFELPAVGTGVANKAGRKQGWFGHFATGLFVTLVATPCSAPFLGTGLGFAFTLPDWGIFLFFIAAALGLALPFLVIGFVPALFKFLPKPGPWIEVFKKIMGFTLVATAVWLTDTIASLTGQKGVIGFLAFLTVASISAWIFGKWAGMMASRRSKIISITVALALLIVGGKLFLVTEIPEADASASVLRTENLDFSSRVPWQPFSDENVAALQAMGKPSFVDFTADW